ncbi:hypothetical protein AAAA50_09355, partial [Escherichia coli]
LLTEAVRSQARDQVTGAVDRIFDTAESVCAYFHERRSLNNFHRDRVITFEQIAE